MADTHRDPSADLGPSKYRYPLAQETRLLDMFLLLRRAARDILEIHDPRRGSCPCPLCHDLRSLLYKPCMADDGSQEVKSGEPSPLLCYIEGRPWRGEPPDTAAAAKGRAEAPEVLD